ncbi:unnamed protein product [Cylindrotheca closterium]|uniref:Uncharacterized protein n=1 Tax=Cylindrotheca closterium TaxID=2856 RepID=A0AAD2G478_9STRA|nr:unnamed protein product [Cylindrotheca closterium]
MKTTKTLKALSTLSFLLIPVASTIVEEEKWNQHTNKHDVVAAMNNEELFRPHRRLNEPVNECLDGSDWLNWGSVSNGINLIRKYFECECTGDLASFFSMKCSLTNLCFFENEDSDVLSDRRGVLEKCVTRIGTYDFRVDPDTRIIYELSRLAESDEYISGFNVTGTMENVNWIPCSNSLVSVYNMSRQEAYGTCSDRERCQSFLSSKDYTAEQIEYICPVAKFNGVECQGLNLAACADFDPIFGIRYTSMPDCSNVIPCMTSSCQPYKRINAAPQRGLFRYPECDGTDSFVIEAPSMAPSSTPAILVPPTMAPVANDISDISSLPPATLPSETTTADESSGYLSFSRYQLLTSIAAMILPYFQ